MPAIFGWLLSTTPSFSSLSELDWENIYPTSIRADMRSVEYDGEKFIAAGSGGAIYYSMDGGAWKQGTVTGDQELLAKTTVLNIRYTGGTYFAFGTSPASAGVVQMTSDDGINWYASSQASSTRNSDVVYAFETYAHQDHNLGTRSIEYGNGTLVRMGRNYRIWISENGNESTYVNNTFAPKIHKLRFLDGQFYALIKEGQIYRSSDGRNWEQLYDEPLGNLHDIALFKGNLFVLKQLGSNKYLLRSTDGLEWQTSPKFYGTGSVLALAASDSELVAVGTMGTILRTIDGDNWSGTRSGTDVSFNYASNGSVLVGLNHYQDSWYTRDGHTLHTIEFDKERHFSNVATFQSGFIAYDYFNQELLLSSDGLEWTPSTLTPEQLKESNKWYIVRDRLFVVPYFSSGLRVATTTDGSHWNYFADFGVAHIFEAKDGYHASERNSSNVHTSTDGVNWVERSSNLDQQSSFHPSIAFLLKGSYFASANNRIYKSANGFQWSVHVDNEAFPYHYSGGIVAVIQNHLVYAGANGSLGVSTDGREWVHFEVGSSDSVQQVMELGDKIVLDLGWRGLIQSRPPTDEGSSSLGRLELDFPSGTIISKQNKNAYSDDKYILFMESDDLLIWSPAANADYTEELEFRQATVELAPKNNDSIFYRNDRLAMRDLFGSWVGVETIEGTSCSGTAGLKASTSYFAEVRISENKKITVELLDTTTLSRIAFLTGVFNLYDVFDLSTEDASSDHLAGATFTAFIGKRGNAPLLFLRSNRAGDDGCAFSHEILLTR